MSDGNQSADPHPWYGPCDALAPGDACAECIKLIAPQGCFVPSACCYPSCDCIEHEHWRRTAIRRTFELRWDADARVWVAESPDIPGLITEAATLPKALRHIAMIIRELEYEGPR